ncbi:hypothetical protein MTP99_016743 [Tenebrio molitor]|jgi:hypothetical protein|nr:hypothetical protein MTP99_016743 [Tenebrio molitor]
MRSKCNLSEPLYDFSVVSISSGMRHIDKTKQNLTEESSHEFAEAPRQKDDLCSPPAGRLIPSMTSSIPRAYCPLNRPQREATFTYPQ